MFKRALGDNEIFYHDPDTDTSYIETISDATPTIEEAKRIKNSHAGGYREEVFNSVGKVDLVVFKEWCKNKGVSFQEAMAGNNQLFIDFLQDPDNSSFRTHPTFFNKRK